MARMQTFWCFDIFLNLILLLYIGTNYHIIVLFICLPSRKLSMLDVPDTQDTAGEAKTNSSVMYSYAPPHMAEQKQDDQLENTYSSYVRIRDVALKTCWRWWTIRKKWREGARDILASGMTWWWWWWWSFFHLSWQRNSVSLDMIIVSLRTFDSPSSFISYRIHLSANYFFIYCGLFVLVLVVFVLFLLSLRFG